MKLFVYISALALVLFFKQTQAQCPSAPLAPSCSGPPNSGFRGGGCIPGTRWYYNAASRRCISFPYNGCGGLANRWCSLASCRQRCEPRG